MQRMCMEHKARLAKLEHIFLTQLDSSTVGGLPGIIQRHLPLVLFHILPHAYSYYAIGLILTVSDTGKEQLALHGPVNTRQYMHATRHFLYR